MRMNFKSLLVAVVLLPLVGCDKEGAANPGGAVMQAAPPAKADPDSGVDLAQMTRDLRRWVFSSKQRPATFEQYASDAKLKVPAAPAGKKFAISQEMRVVLVDAK